ncbi:alpha/beta-hydrolase [Pseudovirgaria hyperparasitica]|uniref:Alpha/beta-hydrolase n=1 Tax=Pseudovirgaria hyperparasitica TaxID=470096 RepID=A0A6A6WIY0_9PEZI|nr:alpha/beta-hydrolase [Pseudovirgaria hyperparasitica]KAF2762050.1 alpha/beta-hydrolase [Pseudovirgaria hyperparasitica]
MASTFSNFPSALGGDKITTALADSFARDGQYLAFTTTDAIVKPITFGIKSSADPSTLLIHVEKGKGKATVGSAEDAAFTLVATPEQWEQFMKPTVVAPYQSYWGMFGMNIKQKGIEVLGDKDSFVHHTHVWRRVLELIHDAHAGPAQLDPEPVEPKEDYIIGRYLWIEAPVWGKTKIFVESAGQGKQQLLFLHTAGSDSRQYHAVMNDKRMRDRCTMFAFDLPGHGRSFPSTAYFPGSHTNTEDSYVGCIAAVVKRLGLRRPIVCGASMAGQICLAVAIRNDEVGAGGVIPLQGCDHLDMPREDFDRSPYFNQSLVNPERVYGMMAPTAPLTNKALIWHLYSAQAYGIFHGDLDFYFGGWDGRDRVDKINTTKCPVYMLTGEFDWSCTPEMSEATARKIPGAQFKSMEGLGHFPATENPVRFIPYLIDAVSWIQSHRKLSVDRSVLRMTDD